LVHKPSTEQNVSNFHWIIKVLGPFEKIRSMGPTPPLFHTDSISVKISSTLRNLEILYKMQSMIFTHSQRLRGHWRSLLLVRK